MIPELHKYQKESLEFIWNNKSAGIFADPGLGKTAIVLHLIDRMFWQSKKDLSVLLIAPLRVCYFVWPQELKKWGLDYLTHSILHGKNRANKNKVNIEIVNVENIFWKFDRLKEYDLLVIDESSKFKNYASKRFKILRKNLDKFDRRVILTGTPSPNSLMDLYSQIYIIDKGRTLGKNITAYRKEYFYPTNYRNFIEWNLKPGSAEQILEKIKPLIYRIDAKDHLDLPDLIYNNVKFDLPKSVLKTYKDFESNLFAEIEGKGQLLSSAASAYLTCRQIANGSMYSIGSKEVILLHDKKIKALLEVIAELQGKPVLVAYHFKHDLIALKKALGEKTPVLGSPTKEKESGRIIADWNNKKIPILLAHPQSIAHGLNLQHGGHDIIWFALTDNLENYIQFNDRVYRQGVSGQVRIHHLIANSTVDLAILRRLQNKDRSQQGLLDALKSYLKGEKENG